MVLNLRCLVLSEVLHVLHQGALILVAQFVTNRPSRRLLYGTFRQKMRQQGPRDNGMQDDGGPQQEAV